VGHVDCDGFASSAFPADAILLIGHRVVLRDQGGGVASRVGVRIFGSGGDL
jgi:hypothetical protein